MKKRVTLPVLLSILGSLSACNGGSNTPQPITQSQNLSVNQAQNNDSQTYATDDIFNDDYDMNMLPDYSIAGLEAAYKQSFCQVKDPNNFASNSLCQQNNSFLASQQNTGFFNLNNHPILHNSAGVTGVNFEAVEYDTNVELPTGLTTFHVSGGVLLPQVDKSKIKGVVVYFHGTTFDKSMVGSNKNNPETKLAAEIFASQGYIVLIPDYIGQGKDWKNVHPYVLFPKVSVKTALDMLSSEKEKIRQTYGFSEDDQLKLFTAGYSEGGAYSLWFTSYVYDNPAQLDPLFKLTQSVGLEGAYSTSEVTKGFLFSDVTVSKNDNKYASQNQVVTNVAKPILSADAFLSYAKYKKNGDYLSVFNKDFFNMNCTIQSDCNIKFSSNDKKGQHVNLEEAFARETGQSTLQILNSALGKSANNSKFYGIFNTLTTKNNVTALVSPAFVTPQAQRELDETLRAADVNLERVPNGSVSIVTLDQDSMVTPENYAKLKNKFGHEKFRYSIVLDHNKIHVMDKVSGVGIKETPIDHLKGLNFEFLYALNIFNSFQ